MKFTKSLRALLVLGLWFRQTDTQTVTVTIGESGPDVFMEWSGSLTALPPSIGGGTFLTKQFYSAALETYVSAAVAPSYYLGGDLLFSGFNALSNSTIQIEADTATGGSVVGVNPNANWIYIARNYVLGQPMTGCLVFKNKSFATMGSGIRDGRTSTTSWNLTTVVQSIIFQTSKVAVAKICAVGAPVTAPVVVPPVTAPVRAPVVVPPPVVPAPVVVAPVAPTPTAPIARAPVLPPIGDSTLSSILPVIIASILLLIGATIAVALIIW